MSTSLIFGPTPSFLIVHAEKQEVYNIEKAGNGPGNEGSVNCSNGQLLYFRKD